MMGTKNGDYDVRSQPQRGVRVHRLPRYAIPAFKRLCGELRTHAQSHYSTWRWAASESDSHTVHANAIYWRSVIKYLSHLEYLGTNGIQHTNRDARPPLDGR